MRAIGPHVTPLAGRCTARHGLHRVHAGLWPLHQHLGDGSDQGLLKRIAMLHAVLVQLGERTRFEARYQRQTRLWRREARLYRLRVLRQRVGPKGKRRRTTF